MKARLVEPAVVPDLESMSAYDKVRPLLERSTMRIGKTIATTAIILSFTAVAALGAESPAASPTAAVPTIAATATPAAAPTNAAGIKPVKKRFLLSHSTSVYVQPDKSSAVIAHVNRRTHINITGLTGDWLRVQLSSGKVGFIPSSAAE